MGETGLVFCLGTYLARMTKGRRLAVEPDRILAGTAALLASEAVAGAAAVDAPVTIEAATRTLPAGMDRATFSDLAGFVQGQVQSSQASTKATTEIINDLQSADVTRESVSAFQRFIRELQMGRLRIWRQFIVPSYSLTY